MGPSRLDPEAASDRAARSSAAPLAAAVAAIVVLSAVAALFLLPDGGGDGIDGDARARTLASRPDGPADAVGSEGPVAPEKEAVPATDAPDAAAGTADDPTAARLVLQFADERGEPVPDLRATLLAPPDPDRPGAPPAEAAAGTADADGVVRFQGLAAADGYRWRLDTPGVAADLSPPHETTLPRPPPADGGRAVPPLVTDTSGRFRLEAGTETRLAATVYRGPGIRGTVAATGPLAGPVQIRVQTRRDHPTTFTDDLPERLVEGPSFHVTGVPPGARKRALIVWEEEGNRFHVARFDFALAEGETRDLGAVGPSYGTAVEGTTALELDGVEVAASDLLLPDRVAAAVVGFRRVPAVGDQEDVIFADSVELELGEPFAFVGLPPGGWTIDLHARFGGGLVEGVRLEETSVSHTVALPEAPACRLVLPATRPVSLPVEIVPPFGAAWAPLRVFGVADDGRVAEASLLVESSPPIVARLAVAPGSWTVFVTTHRPGRDAEADRFGEARVDVTGRNDRAVVELAPGRAYTGRARERDGRPAAGRNLVLTLPRFRDLAAPPRLFTVRTDDAGRFTIRGAPLDERPVFPGYRGIEVEIDP